MARNVASNGIYTSEGSDYAFEEDDTQDEFSKKMIREMREQASKWRAENTRPNAFRKARVRPVVDLTPENLEFVASTGKERETHSARRTVGSISGGSSNASEPPLNVPRRWGRKAKRNTEWLKRITMVTEFHEETPKVGASALVEWSDASEQAALPSIEDSPSSRPASKKGTPASAAPERKNSLRDIQQRDLSDEPFSGSFLASTPAAPSRNTKLEEIRQRELQEELGDAMQSITYLAPSHERQRESTTSSKLDASFENVFIHPAEQPIEISNQATLDKSKHQSLSEPPKSPIAVAKSTHTLGTVDRGVRPGIHKSPDRPSHQREDSRDLLRRLARSASQTPSPAQPVGSKRSPKKLRLNQGQQSVEASKPNKLLAERDTRDQISPPAAVQRASNDVANAKQVEGVKRFNDYMEVAAVGTESDNPVSSLNEPAENSGSRTPVVAGAWIQTPAPSNRSIHSGSDAENQDGVYAKSRKRSLGEKERTNPSEGKRTSAELKNTLLPASALSAIITEARFHRAKHSTAVDDFGDSTIQSLEEIIEPNHQSSFLDQEDDTLDITQLNGQFTAKQIEQARERRTLRMMSAKLCAARNSMRDTRHGLQRVEQKVRNAVEQGAPSPHRTQSCGSYWRFAGNETRPARRYIVTAQNSSRSGQTNWYGDCLKLLGSTMTKMSTFNSLGYRSVF